jgi:hypothetical protein
MICALVVCDPFVQPYVQTTPHPKNLQHAQTVCKIICDQLGHDAVKLIEHMHGTLVHVVAGWAHTASNLQVFASFACALFCHDQHQLVLAAVHQVRNRRVHPGPHPILRGGGTFTAYSQFQHPPCG